MCANYVSLSWQVDRSWSRFTQELCGETLVQMVRGFLLLLLHKTTKHVFQSLLFLKQVTCK